MRTSTHRLVSVLVLGFVLAGVARAQETGGIAGWGTLVVVPQSQLTDLVAVAAGGEHSLGLKADGSIVAWGDNSWGKCNVPAPNTDFVAVAGGGYDSLGLKGYPRGDMNCDSEINFDDIDPFVLAIRSHAGYVAAYPNCNWLNADCNGDGTVDFDDIDPFVALLAP